ncbi:MAG: orotidine-5'-phosphate decarboxylase [Gammaproteobacteria bacterium]|nr:orotidine-5'-phosphate decarboxylase [Gammaproteobacteria bacterium]
MTNRLVIVALDYPSPELALQFVDKIQPDSCALKVGFELFLSGGPQFVEKLVTKGFRIFLDLKFHDIPNTVAQACCVASKLGVWMINVHASGGSEMMLAARDAIGKFGPSDRPKLIAVTVLTSMNQDALSAIGVRGNVDQVVTNWAAMAEQAKLDGVVCSAQEAAIIREQSNQDFMIVTPGIRLPSDNNDDQKRIVSPLDARIAGVTHIVVGRPITQAQDPCAALEVFQKAFIST